MSTLSKTYLAAKYSRREEMETLVPEFKKCGFDVIARWVFGGEEGLSTSDISTLDLDDIDDSESIFVFTHPRSEPQPGGGRFVEMGYALAKNKIVYVIGPPENVFCYDKRVTRFDTLDEFYSQYRI